AFPITLPLELNVRVQQFTLAAAVLVTIASGVAPALGSGRVFPVTALRSASRSVSSSGSRLRSALVASQLAFSLLCLATAGLFVRGLRAASAVNLGFSDPGHVLLVTTNLSAAGFTDSTG